MNISEMILDEIREKVQRMIAPKRYVHSLGVMESAVWLAGIYGCDARNAAIAGLLHDCAREVSGPDAIMICETAGIDVDAICQLQPVLLHGEVGAMIARDEFGIADPSILEAIRCHTTGSEKMDLMAKIIFVADCIEPGRKYEGVDEIRKAAETCLDDALLLGLEATVGFVLKKRALLHPRTVNAWNAVLLEKQN